MLLTTIITSLTLGNLCVEVFFSPSLELLNSHKYFYELCRGKGFGNQSPCNLCNLSLELSHNCVA